jgi:glycosyltransferase involved in cell wall biosynthesis
MPASKKGQEEAPLISIITPSRNQARFIEETLGSVYLQDYRPIEHIVIDAVSSDGTVELLRAWAEKHNDSTYQLKWISEPDRGLGHGVNKGFERARGEVVGWLNSDDVYFDRDAVCAAVNTLWKERDVDAVYGDVALISEDSGLWMIWCFPEFRYERILRGYLIPQPTIFCRKRVINGVRIDPSLPVAHDAYFLLAAGAKFKFKHLHRIQAADRNHEGRLTYAVIDRWAARRQEMYRSFGGSEQRGLMARNLDRVTRVAMRIKGAIYLLRMFRNEGWQQVKAFPLWIDSSFQVLMRQASMRISRRRPTLVRPDLANYPEVRL